VDKDINVRSNTLELLEKKHRRSTSRYSHSNDFLKRTPIAKGTMARTD
jgi:hypothetical protein